MSDKPDEWRCTKCNAPCAYPSQLQRTIDDRWRFGRCRNCDSPKVIFKRAAD